MKYLSRYLYRGVIREQDIVANHHGKVTFKYVDSRTGQTRYRTLKGEDFLWLVLQHVLPKGFRRVRDYGFLHGNARKLLTLIQLTLKVMITATASSTPAGVQLPQVPITDAASWALSGLPGHPGRHT